MKINKLILILSILTSNYIFSMGLTQELKNERALLDACHNGNLKQVKLLVKSGFNIDKKDYAGVTPIMYASRNGYTEIVDFLIKKGANLDEQNKYKFTALIDACRYNFKEIAKLLIKAGADINKKDYEGNTALMEAAMRGHEEIAGLLIIAGADLKERNKFGMTAFSAAYNNKHMHIYNFINLIIENPDEIKKYNFLKKKDEIKEYKNILFEAIKSGDYSIVRQLLRKVTLNIFDENGNNALHLASFYNNPEIFKLILSVRPDLIQEKNRDGKTPIEINPTLDNFNFIKIILEKNKIESKLNNILKNYDINEVEMLIKVLAHANSKNNASNKYLVKQLINNNINYTYYNLIINNK